MKTCKNLVKTTFNSLARLNKPLLISGLIVSSLALQSCGGGGGGGGGGNKPAPAGNRKLTIHAKFAQSTSDSITHYIRIDAHSCGKVMVDGKEVVGGNFRIDNTFGPGADITKTLTYSAASQCLFIKVGMQPTSAGTSQPSIKVNLNPNTGEIKTEQEGTIQDGINQGEWQGFYETVAIEKNKLTFTESPNQKIKVKNNSSKNIITNVKNGSMTCFKGLHQESFISKADEGSLTLNTEHCTGGFLFSTDSKQDNCSIDFVGGSTKMSSGTCLTGSSDSGVKWIWDSGKNRLEFDDTTTPGSLVYPLATLEWQADSWFTQLVQLTGTNDGTKLVPGGLCKGTTKSDGSTCFTSEGIGFQMLIAASMMKLEQQAYNTGKYDTYKKYFDDAHNFVKKNLTHGGLIPWRYNDSGQVTTPKGSNYKDLSSATDADMFIATAELIASQVESSVSSDKAVNKTLHDDALHDDAITMMKSIYDYDTTTSNSITYLNSGGCNAWGFDSTGGSSSARGATPNCYGTTQISKTNKFKRTFAAYTKSILPFMYLFSKADKQVNDDWSTLITNTLSIMKDSQQLSSKQSSKWPGILGFIAQANHNIVSGAIHLKSGYKMGNYSGLDFGITDMTLPSPTLQPQWLFNYDALRVPAILGGYLLVTHDDTNAPSTQIAKTVLESEMKGIDELFFNASSSYVKTDSKNYQKMIIGDDATPKNPKAAYIFKTIIPGESDVTAIAPNDVIENINSNGSHRYPADDAIAGNFLLGQLGLATGGTNQKQLKLLETQLINTSFGSSSYYDPFSKMLSGFFMDGVFTPKGNTNPVTSLVPGVTARTKLPDQTSIFLPGPLTPWVNQHGDNPYNGYTFNLKPGFFAPQNGTQYALTLTESGFKIYGTGSYGDETHIKCWSATDKVVPIVGSPDNGDPARINALTPNKSSNETADYCVVNIHDGDDGKKTPTSEGIIINTTK